MHSKETLAEMSEMWSRFPLYNKKEHTTMAKDKDNIDNMLDRAHRAALEEGAAASSGEVPLEERSEEAKDAIQAIEAMRKYADEDDDDDCAPTCGVMMRCNSRWGRRSRMSCCCGCCGCC